MEENNSPVRFRRSSQSSKRTGRQAIGVLLGLVLLLGLAFAIARLFQMPEMPTPKAPAALPDAPISLRWLDTDTFVLGKDTTNYAALASTLLDSLRSMQQRYAKEQILVVVQLPDTLQTADFQDIIQLVQATNVRWTLRRGGR